MQDITLYYFPTCPYCQRVLHFMQDQNIALNLKNIREHRDIQRELSNISGGTQVPCLVIDGKAILESDHIIEWLKTNYKKNNDVP